MEINPENIERGLWVVLIIVAIWIIRRIRRRSKEADASYRSVSRGFAQRLAKKRPPHEVSLEDVEEDEKPKKHMIAYSIWSYSKTGCRIMGLPTAHKYVYVCIFVHVRRKM